MKCVNYRVFYRKTAPIFGDGRDWGGLARRAEGGARLVGEGDFWRDKGEGEGV